jgi:hypothetical protein
MDEAIVENLSSLANLVLTYGSTLVKTERLDTLDIAGVALIVVLLAARIVNRKLGFLKSFRAWRTLNNKRSYGRLSERQRRPALKPCPNCAEQLPLTAVICYICDYNFLAERPGRGQTLLPAPQPMTHEVREQQMAPTVI